MKFIDGKNIHEFVSNDCMLTCWGGTDNYEFEFVPQSQIPSTPTFNGQVRNCYDE